MFEGTLSVMLLLNPDTGEIVDANMAACNFYGWSYTELTGKRVSDLNTLPQEETIKVMQKAKNSQNNHFVFKHRLASSEIRDVEVYSSPLKFNDATYLLSLIHDITESKRMEKELRESEFFFRESQRAAFIGSYKTDFTHGHWESSEVLDKIFGIDKSYDRSIDNWVAIVHPDDQVMMSDYLTENVFKNRETFNKEYRIVRKSDGQERWVHGLGSIGFDEKGEVISMVGTIQDITDRKEAEECLKQSEDKFRRLVVDMSVGVLLQGPDTEILLSNRKALELLGLTEVQLIGKTSFAAFGNVIHEDGSAFPVEEHPVSQAIATRKAVTDVVMGVYRPATNDRVWLLVNAVPHFNSDQSVKKVVCTFIDITNLKRIENELRESEQRLKFHFENSPLAIVEWDSDFIVKQWSLEAEHIFGWEKEDILGKPIHSLNLIYEEDIPIVANTIVRLTGGCEQTVVSENRNVKKSGEIIDAVWYNSVLLDENGAMISVISLVQDVTQQKKAEDALRKSEEKLQTIYSSMNEGLAIHDIIYENGKAVDYLISDINPAFEKLTGFKRSDALGSKASELYGIGIAPYLDIYASVASGGPSEFFETYFPPLDKYFSISVFSPEMGKFATVFNDISERRRRDELLHKHNLIMSALNKSSQAMVYSSDELLYMNQVCNIVVEDCGFAMVWIGLAEDDEKKSVRPVASAGFEEGYLETLKISWGDNERGRGPTGTAIRTGTISMCWDMGNDPSFELWREEALKRGYASSVVFPLISDERVFGAISIYSREANPFDKQEITLLSELAADLSHGIKAIRLREAQKLAEKALLQSHDKLESLVRERTRELQNTNEALKREIKIRKQQERSIVLAEEKYRTVADHTYNWETWVGNHGKYIYVSPSCYTITGYTVDEFMNDPLLTINIAHPEDREAVRRHYYEEMKGSTATWSLDFRIIHKNGEVRWIGHSCRPIFNSDGKWIGQRASNRDITEQKITELLMISTQQQLRALTHKLDAIAEDERTRIAREIHDELGHLLTALKYDIESLTEKVDLSTPAIVSEFDGILSIIDALIDSVRKISTELRPGVLDHLGLLPAIEWQIRQFQMRTKINCECDIRDTGGSLTKNETTILFRIVQEILTNVARHSKATKLTILLDKNENEFLLKAKDDGVGFEWKENYFINSLGLMGMRERAMSIGGEIKIESAVGQGTTVTFSLKAAVRSENENYVII
jgi:PAS domain S-box-containing protein